MMRRSPGFVVTAVIILAFGCAFTGAVFSTVNGWLAVGAAIPHAEHLVFVVPTRQGAEVPLGYFKETSYTRLFERRLQTVRDLFATKPVPAILSLGSASVNVRMEVVTGAYFQAIGVAPLLGRTLGADDDRPGGEAVVVLGESAWRRLFAEDSHVIGRSIHISGLLCTIVGVMPASVRGFTTPTSTAVDVWAPVTAMKPVLGRAGALVWGQVFGRLAEGVSFRQAEAEMRVAGSRFDPDDDQLGAALLPVERGVMPSRARLGLAVVGTGLVALSALVLLIACANLANLLLARSASRSTELAIRMALGARPSQVLRLQLFETGGITLLGGAVGLALVSWASHTIGRFTIYSDGGSIVTGTLVVDGWVVGYFFVLIVSASLAIGILPAIRSIRIDPAQVLASSGTRGRTTGRFERKRTLLVSSQVAASTVLLIVAGLFVRSAIKASRYDVAFDARHLAIGYFDFGTLGWDIQRGHSQQEILLKIGESMPGILGVAVSTGLPAAGGGEVVDIEPGDVDLSRYQFGPACRSLSVSPGFLQVVGLIPLRGRDFTIGDTGTTHGVVILNEVAASRLWPGRDPVGRRLRIRKGDALEVVGLVPESDRTAKDLTDRCYAFVPMAQRYKPQFILAVKGTQAAAALLTPLKAAVAAAAPDVSMFNTTAADAYLSRAGGPSRSIASALVVLGAFGLVIAIAGLYGVMAYVVGLRRSEFAIRKVLGATNGQIFLVVSRDAGRMLAIGILFGLPVAYAVSMSVGNALIGVTSHDVLTYVFVPASLASVGAIAAWLPAQRAAQVDPAVALRDM
jgi:predicted permease